MRTKELVSPVVSSGMYPAWASSSPLPLLHKREQSFEEVPSGFFISFHGLLHRKLYIPLGLFVGGIEEEVFDHAF